MLLRKALGRIFLSESGSQGIGTPKQAHYVGLVSQSVAYLSCYHEKAIKALYELA